MKLQIPFYLQTTQLNCGPVALKMVLEFLGKSFSIEQLEKESGIKEGKAVSTIRLAIAAAKLGFKTDFSSKILGTNPENMNLDFYKKYNDMNKEEDEKLFQQARNLGVGLHEQSTQLNEITNNIREDRAIIILLDWGVIKKTSGYIGHFAPVVGYDEENIYVHNHGYLNPTPFLAIPKDLFEKARKAKGTDEDIMVIYKTKPLS